MEASGPTQPTGIQSRLGVTQHTLLLPLDAAQANVSRSLPACTRLLQAAQRALLFETRGKWKPRFSRAP